MEMIKLSGNNRLKVNVGYDMGKPFSVMIFQESKDLTKSWQGVNSLIVNIDEWRKINQKVEKIIQDQL